MKSYFLFYADNIGTAEFLANKLDALNVVDDWRYDIPNIMYVRSARTAYELSDALSASLGMKEDKGQKGGHFVFIECTDNAQGYLYAESWNFLIPKTEAEPPLPPQEA